MKERPILFSGPMVRAILEGRKTQTRRVMQKQPTGQPSVTRMHRDKALTKPVMVAWWDAMEAMCLCPYGVPGDRLWVRETWRVGKKHDSTAPRALPHERGITVMFEAGGSRAHNTLGQYVNDDGYPPARPDWAGKLRPAIHLPRWASRITLEVTGIRVERLQEITEADAIAEGVDRIAGNNFRVYERGAEGETAPGAVSSYRSLWESINGAGSWDANPWVWVVEFRRAA